MKVKNYLNQFYDCLYLTMNTSRIQNSLVLSQTSTIIKKGAKRFSWKLNGILNSFKLNFHFLKKDFDIYHITYYTHRNIRRSKKYKTVLTVYDMIHEKFHTFFDAKDETIKIKKELITSCSMIIAISENTKNDILHYYPSIPSEKIKVIHLASAMSDYNAEELLLTTNKFILFVGNRSGYKNFIPMLEAILGFLSENSNVDLICAGGGSFTKSELDF
ncbi:MAG: glycosyltransferase, partial [Crocinitomicaceae bacterium]|nr:glycosyltransferase [Crocinitomicaceae bacterium]